MIRAFGRTLFVALMLSGLVGHAADRRAVTDWPQWRGPDRDGRSPESGLALDWPDGQPRELWRKEIGAGFSGIAVSGKALYTAFLSGGKEMAFRFDAETGAERWRFRMDEGFTEEYGDGPRATPTVDGGTVYVMSSRAKLYALRGQTGKRLWSVDLHAQLADPDAEIGRGYASSPLIEDELLILQVGPADGKAIFALDKRSGDVIWTAQSGRAAFSSPIAVTLDGTRQIVSACAYGLVGLDAESGVELWSYAWETKYSLNIASPVFVAPDRFMISSGYDKGAASIRVVHDETGWNVGELWTTRTFRNHFNTSVYHDGSFYGFDNALLKSIDAVTGEERWVSRGYGKGSLIYADGVLIVLGDDGRLGLVDATPAGFRERAAVQVLEGKCWTAPALAGGRLYVRSDRELVALDLRTRPEAAGN